MIRAVVTLLLVFFAVEPFNAALAQSPAGGTSLTEIRSTREGIAKATTLNPDTKAFLLKSYDQAIASLQDQQNLAEQNVALDKTIKQAPERLADLAKIKERSPPALSQEKLDSLSVEQLESLQTKLGLDLTKSQEALQSAQTRLARLLGSTQSINSLLAIRKAALEQIAQELAGLPESSSDDRIAAHRVALLARQSLYRTEIEYNSKVLTNQSLLGNLAQAERDHANLEIARLQDEIAAIKIATQIQREQKARQAREQADELQHTAIELPREIEQLAALNTKLRTELETALQSEKSINHELSYVSRERQAIRDDFERLRQRVEIVGPNASISSALRNRRSELPRLAQFRQERVARGTEIANAIHRQLEIDDALRVLTQKQEDLKSSIENRAQGLSASERNQMEDDARSIISAYRESLNELQRTWSRYVSQLVTLDLAEHELVTVSRDYIAYIDQQLFWMPSTSAIDLVSIHASDWTHWLTDAEAWSRMERDWRDYMAQHPVKVTMGIVLILLLLLKRHSARVRLEQSSEAVRHVRTDSIGLTLGGLLAHLVRVSPLPALMYLGAEVMRDFPDPVAESYAHSLTSAALLIFSMGMLRDMAAAYGVGASHFGWPKKVCEVIRHELRWFIPFGAIMSFVVAAYANSNPPIALQAIGSACFVLLMLGWAYITVKVFGARSALRTVLREDFTRSWANQLHFIWYPLMLLVPITLAVLSLAGFNYAAVELEIRVQMTAWFLLSLLLLAESILRTLYIAARRMKLEEALRRREIAQAQVLAQRASDDDLDSASSLMTPKLPETNYDSLSEQSKRLVHTGFVFAVVFGTWSIWVDLLPSLGLLRPAGATGVAKGIYDLMPVTTMDILAGVFIIVLTVLAARNIPGLLEIILLQRLPLDAGARYAFTSLTQYGIAGIGLFMAFSTMGLQWDKLQWLIAALGVGLGFGLQEIVANFVSGIILLFERPIRVGDVVTVDNTTGVVTRIQIRATTITNYDRQELVVPNKEFITGRLINWTLSDKLNRVLLPVGLSYSGDADLAMKLMKEAAEEIPDILRDPGPVVSFESFGADSLMLYLRAYLGTLDNRLSVITALHKSILLKFRKAGLEIAFPQRDVHLEIQHPLEVNLRQTRPAGKDSQKAAPDPRTTFEVTPDQP